MSEQGFFVGQTVLLRGVNRRGEPSAVQVTKVGRKLVYIEEYRRERAFRIETGRANDQFGHDWIQTPEEYAAEQERNAVIDRLRLLGVMLEPGRHEHDTATLGKVADLLEATTPPLGATK